MRNQFLHGIFTFAIVLAPAWQIWAESNGSLSGNLIDQQKNSVAGATVKLLRLDGNEALLTVTSDAKGNFLIDPVQPQTYKLRIEREGFKPLDYTESITIRPGRATYLNTLILEPGEQPREGVQKDDQISETLTNDQVRWLPQLLRDPLQLINTQAGVSSNGSTFTTIDGLRPSYNNVTLDGVNIQDNYYRLKSLDYIPNRLFLDQISQFTLITSNAIPEYGNGAAQVAFVTPAGSDFYHGGAYIMGSPNAINANEWFNNANDLNASYARYQGGAKLGGPILKDKLVFYANYEFLRIQDSTQTQMITPDANTRQGMYNGQSVLMPGQTINPAIQAIFNPKTLPLPTSSTIPGFGVAQLSEPDNQSRDNVSLRLDYQITPNHSLTASYAWNREYVNNINADSLAYLPIAPLLTNDNRNFLSLAWRAAITPNLSNELRGGFNLVPITFARQGGLPPYLLDLSQLQIELNLASPIGIPLLAGTENKLYQSIASIDPLSNDWGDGRTTHTYNFQDNATWKRGGHEIRSGFQAQLISDALSDSYNTTPLDKFEFVGPQSIQGALAAVLTGQYAQATQVFNVGSAASQVYSQVPSARHYRYDNYSFYVEDMWRVSRRLTINAGVRYELYPPLQETDRLALVPSLVNNNVIASVLSPSASFVQASGNLYDPQHRNFAPGVGVAFDPLGSGNTVLRAGYSVSYVNDDLIGAVDSTLLNNVGLAYTSVDYSGGTLGTTQAPVKTPTFPGWSSFGLNSNPNSPLATIGMIDPHLRVPYVQQWNFGIQQIVRGFLFDARYVGNHATGMIRGVNLNQVDVCGSGFLNDFIAVEAQQGQNVTPVEKCKMDATNLFAKVNGLYPYLFQDALNTGQVATAAYQFEDQFHPQSLYNLYANPNALLGATILGNYSSSSYNGLQVSVSRQLRQGLQLQGSYTFSKDLSDSARTGDSASEPYRDADILLPSGQVIGDPKLDRARTPFDLTHAIKANFIYLLPFARGLNGPARGLLAGWSLSGIVTVQSGSPFSILSGYATVDTLTAALNTADLVSPSAPHFGVSQYNGSPYYLPSNLTPMEVSKDFGNPTPGRLGYLQQREFSGPWVSDLDVGVQKTFHVREGQSVEFRGEALNILNHPSWLIQDQNINAVFPLNGPNAAYGPVRSNEANPNFGQIDSTFYASRKVQVSAYFRF